MNQVKAVYYLYHLVLLSPVMNYAAIVVSLHSIIQIIDRRAGEATP